ncbi:MAG: hypothetical protein FJ087_12430 [Deltaproteobacteria bacterium]|nr:hypothetical protein [Deltaproteobacteria bacterium]
MRERLRVRVGSRDADKVDLSVGCFCSQMSKCSDFLVVVRIGKADIAPDGTVEVALAVGPVEQDGVFSQLAIETNRFHKGVDEVEVELRVDSERVGDPKGPELSRSWMSYKTGEPVERGYAPLQNLREIARAEPVRAGGHWPEPGSWEAAFIPPKSVGALYSVRSTGPSYPLLFWPACIKEIAEGRQGQ